MDSQAQADLNRRVSIAVPVSIGTALLLAVAGTVAFVIWRRYRRVVKYAPMQDFSTNNDVYHLAPTDDARL